MVKGSFTHKRSASISHRKYLIIFSQNMAVFLGLYPVSGRQLFFGCLDITDAHQIFLKRIAVHGDCNPVAVTDGVAESIIIKLIVGTVGYGRVDAAPVLGAPYHIIAVGVWTLQSVHPCL